jgi:hypothetical protein
MIGIFPADAPLRWCKVQLYSGNARADRHALAALEGMDREPQRLILAADTEHVYRDARAIGFTASEEGWDISTDNLRWSGYPNSMIAVEQPSLKASIGSRDELWWVKVPRVISYWSSFGTLSFDSEWGSAEGASLVEHAWGADSPIDVGRFSPRPWHWDVLRLADGSVCAGFSLGPVWGGRSGGRAPGAEFATGLGLRVTEVVRDEDRLPTRWHGRMAIGTGMLEYDASRSTPVAREVQGGGFTGFTFEGEWRARGSQPKGVTGTGFSEFRAR